MNLLNMKLMILKKININKKILLLMLDFLLINIKLKFYKKNKEKIKKKKAILK